MFIDGYTRDNYLALQNELLFFFSKEHYNTEEEFRKEFEEFKATPFYEMVMAQFGLEEVNIQGKHWRICKSCGKPFLTMDRRSVSITCYREVYRRFSLRSKTYFKKNYECHMAYKRKVANERNRSLKERGQVNA